MFFLSRIVAGGIASFAKSYWAGVAAGPNVVRSC